MLDVLDIKTVREAGRFRGSKPREGCSSVAMRNQTHSESRKQKCTQIGTGSGWVQRVASLVNSCVSYFPHCSPSFDPAALWCRSVVLLASFLSVSLSLSQLGFPLWPLHSQVCFWCLPSFPRLLSSQLSNLSQGNYSFPIVETPVQGLALTLVGASPQVTHSQG